MYFWLCAVHIYYVQTSHVKTRLATARNFQDSFQSSRLLFHQKKKYYLKFYAIQGGKIVGYKKAAWIGCA